MKRPWILLLCLLVPFGATAAETCNWLPVGKVAKAFPEFAPWSTMSGGKVGSCQFLGRTRAGPAMFGLNQMVQNSPGKAQDLVADMRRNLPATMETESDAALGKFGFRYRPKDDAASGARSSLMLVGHEDRVVVLGSLTVPGEITPAQASTAVQLAAAAFALARDKESLAAATRCPYFDRATLARLFKGASVSEQVYGANSCVASAGKRVLMLAIMDKASEQVATSLAASGNCTVEALPELGSHGSIGHDCKDGNARATVRYLKGGRHFQFDWVPGAEPSGVERALLVELARAANAGD